MTAHARPPVLRVGCAMWAHRPWVGRFFSAGVRQGHELGEYAQWCNAVEGNTTFYATPPPATVARWATLTSPDFRFAFKVPRRISHELRLRSAHDELREFLDAIAPLGSRIGPLQVQLPPSFGPESIGALADFVDGLASLSHQALGRSPEWVVELRHPSFFGGGSAHRAVEAVLAAAGIGRVVLDARPVHSASPRTDAAVEERRSKPLLPIELDGVGSTPIVRLIGEDDVAGTLAGALVWAPVVAAWLAEGRRPYVFVHQPENLESPALARAFHDAVRALVADVAPLPDPPPVAPAGEISGQASLW